ncbi:MAG: adenylate/guanylate cyclase domain-containing protein [Chlamydiales bacterium]
MKLHTKLFIGLTFLLCIYAIVVFILPTFIIITDMSRVADRMHALIVEKDRRLVRDQEVLIEDILQSIRTSINSVLFMIYESSHFYKEFEFQKGQADMNVWAAAIQVASYNPNIGLVQVRNPQLDRVIALSPAETNLYRLKSTEIEKGIVAILVEMGEVGEVGREEELYLGIELPKDYQEEGRFTYYAVVSWNEALQEFRTIQSELQNAKKTLSESKRLDVGQIFLTVQDQVVSALDWSYKMDMIKLLMPLSIEGLTLLSEKKWVPEGLARVDKDGDGELIFSKEAFRTTLVFDDQEHFSSHVPPAYSPPLGEGTLFIDNHTLQHLYLANTLKIGDNYITLGSAIDPLAQQFSIWADKPILIRVGDTLKMGFNGSGGPYSTEDLNEFLKTDLLEHETGIILVQGMRYFFANITEFEGGRLGLYELSPLDGQQSIATLSLTVARKLAWKISFQLFIISLVVIALILFTVSRITLRVAIRPIVKLAAATEYIVAGRYEEVQLPNVGKRRDEVAILTHSFEEMVRGLQEKEKIRGVLDKVVSKDVANEILKSQIHLGGEDRVVSTLFGDIRGFTQMTEKLSPQKTIEILNGCMTKITRVIEGEGGVIDKFVGDAIMAIYGAPVTHPEHPLRAVSSGVLILKALTKWNQERIAAGEPAVEMGIGINTGVVVAGNMGAEDRLNYTVLGKNVNISARLCALAKPGQLIISEFTYEEPKIKDSFFIEPLPSVMLKGFSEPFRIYHVIDFKWSEGSSGPPG